MAEKTVIGWSNTQEKNRAGIYSNLGKWDLGLVLQECRKLGPTTWSASVLKSNKAVEVAVGRSTRGFNILLND